MGGGITWISWYIQHRVQVTENVSQSCRPMPKRLLSIPNSAENRGEAYIHDARVHVVGIDGDVALDLEHFLRCD